MKHSIREAINNFKALSTLRKMIPRGSVIHSFALFDGGLEVGLAHDDRFVVAHTTKYPVYEFWSCALKDPVRIATLSNFLHPVEENTHKVLQENWARYQDPYLRAALFFLLNQCSDSGLISSGVLDNDKYNSFAVSRLTNFKSSNIHIEFDNDSTLSEAIQGASNGDVDYLLVPAGNYSYGFLHHGKIQSYETTPINHKELFATMKALQHKWVLVYNFHKEVRDIYKEFKQTMIDKYGNPTLNEESCKELIIANF